MVSYLKKKYSGTYIIHLSIYIEVFLNINIKIQFFSIIIMYSIVLYYSWVKFNGNKNFENL